MRRCNRAGIEQDGDTGFFHFLLGEVPQRRRYFGQNLILGMNQGNGDITLAKVSIKAGTTSNELVDLSGHLGAAEARSYDDEAEVPATTLGIARGLRPFHLTNDVLPKINCIAHDLEGERMLGHSWN